MPCVAEVVNRSLKADCTDYNQKWVLFLELRTVKFFFIRCRSVAVQLTTICKLLSKSLGGKSFIPEN